MTYQAVFLLLLAAVIHAAWNFLGKRQRITPAAFLIANTLGTIFLLIPIALYTPGLDHGSLSVFPLQVWKWVLLTGLFQALYYLGLAGAYKTGDLSLAYPLLRGIPVVLVLVVNSFMGRSAQISTLAVIGMFLVASGALLLPQERFSGWNWQRWLVPAVGWAMFAAVNTVGYSLVDDHALRILRGASDSHLGVTLIYAFWEGVSASVWLCLILLPFAQNRFDFTMVLRTGISTPALTGLGVYLAYTLVLVAMGFVRNVSYVVAFRQSSILIGALLGMIVLKEPRYPSRLVGVGILFIGLLMVGMG